MQFRRDEVQLLRALYGRRIERRIPTRLFHTRGIGTDAAVRVYEESQGHVPLHLPSIERRWVPEGKLLVDHDGLLVRSTSLELATALIVRALSAGSREYRGRQHQRGSPPPSADEHASNLGCAVIPAHRHPNRGAKMSYACRASRTSSSRRFNACTGVSALT